MDYKTKNTYAYMRGGLPMSFKNNIKNTLRKIIDRITGMKYFETFSDFDGIYITDREIAEFVRKHSKFIDRFNLVKLSEEVMITHTMLQEIKVNKLNPNDVFKEFMTKKGNTWKFD